LPEENRATEVETAYERNGRGRRCASGNSAELIAELGRVSTELLDLIKRIKQNKLRNGICRTWSNLGCAGGVFSWRPCAWMKQGAGSPKTKAPLRQWAPRSASGVPRPFGVRLKEGSESLPALTVAALPLVHHLGNNLSPGQSDFYGIGNKGQYIYISPQKNLVIVRNGIDYGLPSARWVSLFYDFASALTARFAPD
jgi:hypothetical protein